MRQINLVEGKVVAPEGMKVGIVAARFNEIIVNKLLGGAVDGLVRHGVEEENITAALDNLRVFRIDLQELRTEKVCTTAHGKGYGKGQDHTVNKHPVHTFRFSHTIILTGKAHASLGN